MRIQGYISGGHGQKLGLLGLVVAIAAFAIVLPLLFIALAAFLVMGGVAVVAGLLVSGLDRVRGFFRGDREGRRNVRVIPPRN